MADSEKNPNESRKATIVMPDQGDKIYAGGDLYRFLAISSQTENKYSIWEAIVPPGGGPPPHLHTREEEGFYIISGEVVVYVDGQKVVAKAGSFVNMPINSTHYFRNETTFPAKMLVIVAPGGMEGLFQKTGKPVTDVNASIPLLTVEEKKRIAEFTPEFGIKIQH